MPFTLHPSGYAVFYSEGALNNLKHDNGGAQEFGACRSRRGKFFDRVTALYYLYRKVHLWTFTVPQLQVDYKNTDKFFAQRFSMLLENYRKRGLIKSYVYVTEAQKRGNIHFHLVTNNQFIPVKEVNDYWCKLIGQYAAGAVDLSVMDNKDIKRLPSYLAKYMSKHMSGKDYKNGNKVEKEKTLKSRVIYARSFNSSRDLARWKAIRIETHQLPTYIEHKKVEKILQVSTVDRSTGEIGVREILKTEYYFNSIDVIKQFKKEFYTQPKDAGQQKVLNLKNPFLKKGGRKLGLV